MSEGINRVVKHGLEASDLLPGIFLESLGHILFQVPSLAHGLGIRLVRQPAGLIHEHAVLAPVTAQSNDCGGVASADGVAPAGQPFRAAHVAR